MKRRLSSALAVWLVVAVAVATAQNSAQHSPIKKQSVDVGEALATDEPTTPMPIRAGTGQVSRPGAVELLSRGGTMNSSGAGLQASGSYFANRVMGDYGGGCTGCAAGGPAGCRNCGCGNVGCGNGACCAHGSRCGGCACCGSRYWSRVELLTWWSRGGHLPPLVTTSPNGTAEAIAGVLDEGFEESDTASILYGGHNTRTDERYGGRIQFGAYVDPSQCWMVGGEFFALGNGDTRFTASSEGDPILARPFLNMDGGEFQDAELVAFPDVIAGTISVRTDNDVLGAGAFMRRKILGGCGSRLDFLAGYRFFRMDDSLIVQEDLVAGPDNGLVQEGSTFDLEDLFDVHNEFHGGEIGLLYELRRARWNLSMLGRVAFGGTQHHVLIRGSTGIFVPGPPEQSVLFDRGLFAQQTNSGRYEDSSFAVLPEAGVTLGYQLTCNCSVSLGYTFMYLSSVSRASEQVDTAINGQLLDGNFPVDPARPRFRLDETDFWLQGVNLGLEFRR